MDLSLMALAAVTVLNVGGWIYTKTYTYGKFVGEIQGLKQKVRDLDDTINNGLVEKVTEVSTHVAKLEGTVSTYINLTKDKK